MTNLMNLWNKLTAKSGFLAYLPMAITVLLTYIGASWQIFASNTDAARYQCYGLFFWLGSKPAKALIPDGQCSFLDYTGLHAPFHMLPLEYPPITLVPFSIPLIIPLPLYQIGFAVFMALVAVAIYALLLHYGPQGSALAFAFYLIVGAWATALGRYDLLPAGLTLLTVIAAQQNRWTLAYLAAAFATLLKIYPVLLLPALFIAEQQAAGLFHTPGELTVTNWPKELWLTVSHIFHWRWKRTGLFLAILLVVTGLFSSIDFNGAVVSQFSYFSHRPVQIESFGSTLLWMTHHFLLIPTTAGYDFGSVNVYSPLGDLLTHLCETGLALGILCTLITQWRRKINLAQSALLLLLLFIGTGKVFSPQYLIWVIPLVAYMGGINLSWLLSWTCISALTTAIYPYLYNRFPDATVAATSPGFPEVVGLRNLLFMLLTLAYLFNWFNVRQHPEQPVPTKRNQGQAQLS